MFYCINIFLYCNRVVRSYSDAHESSLSLGFSKFEEKKKQQSEKRSKTIKSIIKRGHTSKGNLIIFLIFKINLGTDALAVYPGIC